MSSWPSNVGSLERCRRLIDLFVVSVLLDAGAGTKWQYKSKESGKIYKRSEGLAVASLEMFKAGLFSSNADNVFQVDCQGLSKLTVETVGKALQVSESNPITGLEGRTNLLIRLSQALNNDEIFGEEGRPGGMLSKLSFSLFLFTLFLSFSPLSPSSVIHFSFALFLSFTIVPSKC